MEEHMTPEEKLLQLIRKKDKEPFIRGLLGFTKSDPGLFKLINIILISLVGIAFSVVGFDIFFLKDRLPDIEQKTGLNQVEVLPRQTPEPQIPSYAEIDQAISKRDLFRAEKSTEGLTQDNISQNLNLLGIITGDRPQAVIEDKTQKKNYFLYKGENLMDLKVIEIKEGKVILDNNGEMIELTM